MLLPGSSHLCAGLHQLVHQCQGTFPASNHQRPDGSPLVSLGCLDMACANIRQACFRHECGRLPAVAPDCPVSAPLRSGLENGDPHECQCLALTDEVAHAPFDVVKYGAVATRSYHLLLQLVATVAMRTTYNGNEAASDGGRHTDAEKSSIKEKCASTRTSAQLAGSL